MGLKIFIFIVLFTVFSLNISRYGIEGIKVNEKPVKPVRGLEGDIYDCIDVYKQPSLAHPLLKDHKIQMKPSFHLDGLLNEVSSKENQSKLQPTSVECPLGTIPIRRTQGEELIRAKAFNQENLNIHPFSYQHDYNRAIFVCDIGAEAGFHGARGTMNVLNPRVGNGQITYSLIWVEHKNRANSGHDYITAGWAIAPQLNGDFKTRFFTYWESTSRGKTVGCINNLCPGFVHVATKFPLNTVINPVSVYGANPYELSVVISQDKATGNWWLSIPNININVGYWPKAILPNLAIGASRVAFGGMSKASPDGLSPQMGYGRFPDGDEKHSGYFVRIGVVNGNYTNILPEVSLAILEDARRCYRARNGHYQGKRTDYVLTYGGPGGQCLS